MHHSIVTTKSTAPVGTSKTQTTSTQLAKSSGPIIIKSNDIEALKELFGNKFKDGGDHAQLLLELVANNDPLVSDKDCIFDGFHFKEVKTGYYTQFASSHTLRNCTFESGHIGFYKGDLTPTKQGAVAISIEKGKVSTEAKPGCKVTIDEATPTTELTYEHGEGLQLSTKLLGQAILDLHDEHAIHDLFIHLEKLEGCTEAQFQLGRVYKNSTWQELQDETKAIQCFQAAAQMNHIDALKELINFNDDKVLEPLQKNPHALFHLGELSLQENPALENRQKAVDYLRAAKDAGYLEREVRVAFGKALFELGMLQFEAKNYKSALPHLLEASGCDNYEAKFQLAIMYSQGIGGVFKIENSANELLTTITKHKKGVVPFLPKHPFHCKHALELARAYWRIGSRIGYMELKEIYSNKKQASQEIDARFNAIVTCLKMTVEQGSGEHKVSAAYFLAKIYSRHYRFRGTFRLADESGETTSIRPKETHPESVVKYYEIAFNEGMGEAAIELAEWYGEQHRLRPFTKMADDTNFKKAIEWYSKAACVKGNSADNRATRAKAMEELRKLDPTFKLEASTTSMNSSSSNTTQSNSSPTSLVDTVAFTGEFTDDHF